MKIAYLNVYYDPESAAGGHAHIYQFIKCASRQGHEVWTWPIGHPDAHDLPPDRWGKARVLRTCDAVIFRLEGGSPEIFKLFKPWFRWTLGKAKVVWEFNTVPEFGHVVGQSQKQIDDFRQTFRKYAKYCDLAVCVSQRLSEYVRDQLGVRTVVTVPNGTDPELFYPELTPHSHVRESNGLNVIWMGGAGLKWANFELIRKAAKILWNERSSRNINVYVLGADFEGLRDMSPNIHYLGKDKYENIPAWLAGMDVGLISYSPGASEYSSPLKLFDYMASGLAVVTSDQPQASAIIESLGYGEFIVQPDDAPALAERLRRLAADERLLTAYQNDCRQLAMSQYKWSDTVAKVFHEIKQLKINEK